MSKCYICGIEQTPENSNVTKTRTSGFNSRCKKCDKSYMKEYRKIWYSNPENRLKKREQTYKWRKENPAKEAAISKRLRISYIKIMHSIKINGCAICGYNKCDCSLDFHHGNPKNKKFNLTVSGLMRHPNNTCIEELNKCILLCRNCHGEIHELERKSNF